MTDNRRFTVWVDDTPVLPEVPLNASEAVNEFKAMLREDPDQTVEIREFEAWA
jgi:hypothetical protein